jgi:hypothetical protein
MSVGHSNKIWTLVGKDPKKHCELYNLFLFFLNVHQLWVGTMKKVTETMTRLSVLIQLQ